jgi:DNA uptake protein ComE-like DNA-binding protein
MPVLHGSVLIVVLWACLGLVSITLLFGHSMLMTYRGSDNDLSGRQADQAIEGAVRYVQTLLLNAETPGQFLDPTTYISEAVPVGAATFWILGRPLEAGEGTAPEPGLIDEASKLNLNTASQAQLESLPGMIPDLAAAIIEWRTTDSNTSGSGGVNASAIKHAPFESIDELALVTGATREILYGEDANLNGFRDPNEDDGTRSLPADNSDGKLDPGILEYVTVFSREPLLESDGTTARMNVNVTPLPAEFWTMVGEKLTDKSEQEILQLRIQVGPGPFRSVLQFYIRSGLSAEEFALLAGSLTASTAAAPRSGVNVNTASETVLTAVLGSEKAAALVAARQGRDAQDTDITWLKDALGGTPEEAAAATADLTLWSWQVTADIAAVGRHGRGYRRAKVVIDHTTATPKIIYRRDLTPLGWALGSAIRQDLALKKDVR